MSEGTGAAASPIPGPTAGRLLREARERQGLHIAVLAASIKVTPKKLELLESDRFDLLPDATFARALAQTVCRALKIDSAPIMRLLPPAAGHRLEQVGEGLNTPFRDRSGAPGPLTWTAVFSSVGFWATALILIAAAALYLLPLKLPGFASSGDSTASSAVVTTSPAGVGPAIVAASSPAVASPQAPAPALPAVLVPGPAEAASAAADASSLPAARPDDGAAGILRVSTSATSWVEVVDSRGQSLLSRLVQAGEAIDLDGTPPFRLRIGNADATRISFRGQPVELAPFARDNVARFELK